LRAKADIEQWSQSSGSNVITRRARPGLAGPRPHKRASAAAECLRAKAGTGTPRVRVLRTTLQRNLAHKKAPPPRTLQEGVSGGFVFEGEGEIPGGVAELVNCRLRRVLPEGEGPFIFVY